MDITVIKDKVMNVINNYKIERYMYNNDNDNTKYINKYINHIYIINLESDKLRRNYVVKLMEKYNINCELIIVPKLSEYEYNMLCNNTISIGEAGCYISHMFCLHDAITNNYNNIIIFEDDVILHKRFHEIFEQTIIHNNDFDILLLGASDYHFSKLNYGFVDTVNNIYRPHKDSIFLCGSFATLYSKNAINTIFKTRLIEPTYFDNNIIQFLDTFTTSFGVVYPNIVCADLSTTNLNHTFWITSEIKEQYYYRKCFNNMFIFTDYNIVYLYLLRDIIINAELTAYTNITEHIDAIFQNNQHIVDILQQRTTYDFFSVSDLKYITHN